MIPSWVPMAVLAVLPFITYAYAHVTTKYEVMAQERVYWTRVISDMEKKINADAEAKIAAALEAAASESPTPEAPEEIAALCQKDSLCRDRTP